MLEYKAEIHVFINYSNLSVSDFRLTWKLDALKNDSSRVYFLHAEDTRELSLTETYYKDTMKCETALGYLVVSFHVYSILNFGIS